MDATPALILTRHELKQLMQDTAAQAAVTAVANMKTELRTDPKEQVVHRLRQYLNDPISLSNPREYWANGHHIRSIVINSKGKPKSMGWFMQFKRKSGLYECVTRTSSQHGRLQEWTFEDIRLCWEAYYAF